MGVYLFTLAGTPLLAVPGGDRLPMEPTQVEGILALAGEFRGPQGGTATSRRVSRMRCDGYQILGTRGERAFAAAVYRDAPEEVLLPELRRFLRRCEKRLRGLGKT